MARQRVPDILLSLHEWLSKWLSNFGGWLKTTQEQDFNLESIRGILARASQKFLAISRREHKLSFKQWYFSIFRQHLSKLALYIGLPVLVVIALVLLQNESKRLNDLLKLRPAQVNLLQSLVYESNANRVIDVTPVLTENDIETMRVIMQNRGISPNVLLLNLDLGGAVELDIAQATFGQWIAFLEEAARRWHLFPIQLTIKSADSPEIVSIHAILQQKIPATP